MRVMFNNADYYLENIVVEHVMPFALFVGCYFILMQDNARSDTAGQYFLNRPNGPALNHREHMGNYFKSRRLPPVPIN